jgi:hypothetical protein
MMKSDSSVRYFQHEALVENIARYIDECQCQSLLDIGAGTPSTALPLAARVRSYLAIESDFDRAQQLRNEGLVALCGRFPMSIPGSFDLVLSSHSIPEGRIEEYPPFLKQAWDLVTPGGLLLIVTFKGSQGDIFDLRRRFTLASCIREPQFELIAETLAAWGQLRIEAVNSYAQTTNVGEMITFLNPWIFGTLEEALAYEPQLKDTLMRLYKMNDTFVFPTQHLFISCRKR